jgi:hypothetical protein
MTLVLGIFLPAAGLPAAAPPEGANPPFPEMAGWKLAGEIQTFSPANLYDYIDGAADLYLKYDFQELKLAEYENDRKASVTIEVYRHKTPVLAFGIYSQERLGNADYLAIGTQGYAEKGILNFLAGESYVKMSGVDLGPTERAILTAFAEKVAEKLGGKGALPAALSHFPAEGRKANSEKFIAREFLGYSFFRSAFTADYELSGRKFQLFLIETRDAGECRDMVRAYLRQVGAPQDNPEEGRFRLKDPYHGEMDFTWKGNHLFGALDLADEPLRARVLTLMAEALDKRP